MCRQTLRRRVTRAVVAILAFAPLAGIWAHLWISPNIP